MLLPGTNKELRRLAAAIPHFAKLLWFVLLLLCHHYFNLPKQVQKYNYTMKQ